MTIHINKEFDLNQLIAEVQARLDTLSQSKKGTITVYNLSIDNIDKILYKLNKNHDTVGGDWNGCDLDFSGNFEYLSRNVEYWGSGKSGSLCLEFKA